MLLIKGPSTDPVFNMAMEEYLLCQRKEEVICLWRNRQAVIVGRNQNTIEEVDLDFVKANDICVMRRLTGGGAVFHDLGNVNFTLIEPNTDGSFSDYDRFTAPIRAYLATLGVDAQLSGRNDVTVDGQKISGNAQTVKEGRIMHHGTLLFAADFANLAGALRPKAVKIESKGVKSIRSRVTNIAGHLPAPMTVEAFYDGLCDYFLATVPGLQEYRFTPEDLAAIQKLVDEKYALWEWSFGNSPAFDWQNTARYEFGIVDLRMSVQGGQIDKLKIFGDFFGLADIAGLENALVGVRHEKEAILRRLEELSPPLGHYIHGMTPEMLANMMI